MIGGGGGLEKENFCAVISMNICNDDSIHPLPPFPTVLFHTTFYIDAFRVSSMISPIPSLSDPPTPFSQNFSAVRAEPTPYNFHTLNEIKDLCNMQTDGRTDGQTD